MTLSITGNTFCFEIYFVINSHFNFLSINMSMVYFLNPFSFLTILFLFLGYMFFGGSMYLSLLYMTILLSN